MDRKKEIRQLAMSRIAQLDGEYYKEADRAIAEQVFHMPEYKQADTLFCYVGAGWEIDTKPILTDALAAGKRVAVPRCVGKGKMEARRIHALGDLVEEHYGIPEPSGSAERILPEEIDLALIPCVACGLDGSRLGYGGGYYDRYLAQTDAPGAVLCRARLIRDDIPMEEHDRRMDFVVSEEGVCDLMENIK